MGPQTAHRLAGETGTLAMITGRRRGCIEDARASQEGHTSQGMPETRLILPPEVL